MYTELCTNLQDHYKGNMPNKVRVYITNNDNWKQW